MVSFIFCDRDGTFFPTIKMLKEYFVCRIRSGISCQPQGRKCSYDNKVEHMQKRNETGKLQLKKSKHIWRQDDMMDGHKIPSKSLTRQTKVIAITTLSFGILTLLVLFACFINIGTYGESLGNLRPSINSNPHHKKKPSHWHSCTMSTNDSIHNSNSNQLQQPTSYAPALTHALHNATYLIFHRLSKTGTSTFLANMNKFSSKKSCLQVEGLPKIRINLIDEIGAYTPIDEQTLDKYHFQPLKKCFDQMSNITINYTHCFVNTQMPFIDDFNKMAQATHLQFSCSYNYNYNDVRLYNKNPFTNGIFQFMTFIRNPITRIESFYYYIRGMGGHGPQLHLERYKDKLNKMQHDPHSSRKDYQKFRRNHPEALRVIDKTKDYSFHECIQDLLHASKKLVATKVVSYNPQKRSKVEYLPRLDTCRLSVNYMTQYYCGIDPIVCNPRHLNKRSLERAKYNLDTYFTFVGLFEEYDLSMKMIYKRYSYLFDENKISNMKQFINQTKKEAERFMKEQKYRSVQHERLDHSHPLWRYLESRNNLDLELYEYVKQRFYQHAKELQIS